MKSSPILQITLVLVVFGLNANLARSDVPKPLNFARYEPMLQRSPFAVATAAAPAPTAPSFAKDLYVANAARLSEGGLVTIGSSVDKNFKKYLSTQTTVEGFSVPNIEWSDRVGATKVTISKDGQSATLTFNQALLNQPPSPNAPAQAQQAAPLPPSAVPNVIKPAPIPTLPTPPPRVRGVIQRNPVAPPVPTVPPLTDDIEE